MDHCRSLIEENRAADGERHSRAVAALQAEARVGLAAEQARHASEMTEVSQGIGEAVCVLDLGTEAVATSLVPFPYWGPRLVS